MSTLETKDGVLWGYGRSGQRGGRPVLLHHGLIGDATLHPLLNELGEAHGLEWVVIERPGHGHTPPRDMGCVADWPPMVGPVLEVLEIGGSFDAVGVSAGAPYAYALAAGMPERVGRLCILAGVPFIQVESVLSAYPEEAQAAYARYAMADETALRAEFRAFCQGMAERFSADRDLSGALDAILDHEVAGPAREARLQARDWGFGPTDIRCPVDIWHAKADDMVPYAAARRSANTIPEATLHVQSEPSHMASEVTLREMVTRLGSG